MKNNYSKYLVGRRNFRSLAKINLTTQNLNEKR